MPLLINLGHHSQTHQFGLDNEYRLLYPSSKNCEQYWRTDNLQDEHGFKLLFDPQLYLATGIDPERTGKLAPKLATYSWFPTSADEYDSGQSTVREWMNDVESDLEWDSVLPTDEDWIRASIQNALEFQQKINCYRYILPAPIITGSVEESLEQYLRWAELGAEVAREMSLEVLHSLPIMDYLMLMEGPDSSILQTVLDNLVASTESGLYLTVIRSSNAEKRLANRDVVASCLYTSLTMANIQRELWLNGLDDLGYLCVAAGATGFATGPYNKQKRTCLQDFFPGGGRQLPRFYSHDLVGDLYAQRDLLKLQHSHLTRLVKNDVSPASANLHLWLEAITRVAPGAETPNIPAEWRETPNNVSSSHSHRLQLLRKRTEEMEQLERPLRLERALVWLQSAVANAALIHNKIGAGVLDEDFQHLEVWLAALEMVIDRSREPGWS